MRSICCRFALAVLVMTAAACGGGRPAAPAASAPAATPAASANGSLAAENGVASTPAASSSMSGMNMPMMPHSDHKPRHGGIVLMNGDLHFEVVMKRSGEYEVYFSDAMRRPLPATLASDVTITVSQQGFPPEPLTLQIDDSNDFWVGHGRPVTDPNAMARIAYVVAGKPYWIDMPYVQPVAKDKGGF